MTRSPAIALLFCLAACSSEPTGTADEPATAADEATAPVTASPSPAAPPPAPPQAPVAPDVLTLEGLGLLRIGEAVPAGSGWAERGAQISDECRIVSSPDFPGVYAIVEQGRVRRISIGERSNVALANGLGVGATAAEVRAAFPLMREEPHTYQEPPASYLTSPDAAGGGPALRFEIGSDGKASVIHVGTMPVLGYVEGCA